MFILFDLFSIAFIITLFLTPLVRDFALRRGWVDKPDSVRKLHKDNIPRIGGIAVAISYLLTCIFIYYAPYQNISSNWAEALHKTLFLLPSALIIFGTGLTDDIYSLKPWQKLVGQVLAATVAHYAGFGVASVQGVMFSEWMNLLLSIGWLVFCTNAFNLIDGLDGLATGVGLFASVTTLIAALLNGSYDLAVVVMPLVGSLLAFLRYNFNPASVFLGDCGSLLIGFLLGCYGAAWSQKSATVLGVTVPLMALALPLLDATLSILRRIIRGHPVFSGDRRHIHHQLLARGLTPRRTSLILYFSCAVAAVFSLLTMTGQRMGGIFIVLFCVAVFVAIQQLGYVEFHLARQLLSTGAFPRMVNDHIVLQELVNRMHAAGSVKELWEVMLRGYPQFGFCGIRWELGATHLEDIAPSCKAQHLLELKLPLPNSTYLLLYLPATPPEPTSLASSAFSQALCRVLLHKLPLLQTEHALPELEQDATLPLSPLRPSSDGNL